MLAHKTFLQSTVVMACTLVFILGMSSSVQATTMNGGFETGDFTDWMTIGITSVETAAFGSGPPENIFQALLQAGDEEVGPGGFVLDDTLEVFLDLPGGTLEGLVTSISSEGPTVGSAISQTFMGNAGDLVSFQWNFLTNEDTPDNIFTDTAFVVLNGVAHFLADTNSVFSPSSTNFNSETGFATTSFLLSSNGSHTLGFGVVNAFDQEENSGLLVDHVSHTPSSSSPIPEPSTMLLFGTGFVGLAVWRWKAGSRN